MKFDVAIIGGGLAGLALAAALRRTALSVVLIEGRAPAAPAPYGWDARVYAISPANARFLEDIGIWPHLDPTRMTQVRAMDICGDAGGRLEFSAYASGVSELAWILESSHMQRELWETIKRQGNLTLLCPARPASLGIDADMAHIVMDDGRSLSARLVVAADGADSWTRTAAGIDVSFSPYDQLGVVANFSTSIPHQGTAFQWFREDGVLAWLPLAGERISMVWSAPAAAARELLTLNAEALAEQVAAAGDRRLGGLELITAAAGFPLRLMRAPRMVGPRVALIGDAAHTIHPLSGHGINLGYQDARALATVLCDKPAHVDCGDLLLLRRYDRARKEEVLALQAVTDGLHRLFSPVSRPISKLRNSGLNLTNHFPVVKDLLVRYALAA